MLAQAPSTAVDPTLVNPRLLSSAEAAVIGALLLLLFLYRRRAYILWWMWGWVLLSAASALTAHAFVNDRVEAMAYGTAQFMRLGTALLFVGAADAYRQKPRLRRSYAVLLLPVAIWFTLSPAALGSVAVFAPGFILAAGALAASGVAHLLVARQSRMLGASLIGVLLLIYAGVNGWLATMTALPEGPRGSLLLSGLFVLYLLLGLGMQLMAFEDMTYELRHANRSLATAQAELRQLVISDSLTGCHNRRFFDEIIGRELQRHKRYRTPLSLVFIDIDRFKAINDTLGHETGDRVLCDVAGFLVGHFREADYVFRWGGDEFLVLISCGETEALARGAAIQEAFAASPHVTGLPKGVALSIGAVEIPVDARDVLPLVQAADERMYVNKKRRRRSI